MGLSIHQKKKIESLEEKARIMYEQGLTTREVGKMLKKSHTWVWLAVKKEKGEKELTEFDKK